MGWAACGVALSLPGIFTSRGVPKCSPQSAQGLPVLQYTPLRKPRCGTRNIASSARTLNCAGPRSASKLVREAPE
eukprot:8000520-Alexandrium_andersonii.AAC.1